SLQCIGAATALDQELPDGMAGSDDPPLMEGEELENKALDAARRSSTSFVRVEGGIEFHVIARRYTGFRERPFHPLSQPSGSLAPGRPLRELRRARIPRPARLPAYENDAVPGRIL